MGTLPDFESIKQTNILGQEYWSARDLMVALGYNNWQNFEKVIKKAMEVCELAQQDVLKHFIPANHFISIGFGAKRNIINYYFTRYAVYIILSRANPQKS